MTSPILWVAQTEELCEQAVETWSELWRAKGPPPSLTISRLRRHFEAEEAEQASRSSSRPIAKLDAGVFTKKYVRVAESKASCIVVDEAHTSVGPSYTRLLEWQGLGPQQSEDRDVH